MISGLVLLPGCTGRPRSGDFGRAKGRPAAKSFGSGKLAEIDLSEGAPESGADGRFFPLPASRTHVGLVRALERLRADERATGVFVRLGSAVLGWSRSEEIGRLLAQLRSDGLSVVCHAHALSNSTLWLAARGCDRLWLSPAGEIDTAGIASQMVYLKGALDKLDVSADFLHMGKYKSAAEPLTEEGPSEASREAMKELLRSMRSTWLEGLDKERKEAHLSNFAEHGPYSPKEAHDQGVVDALGYESDALLEAKKRAAAGEVVPVFGPKTSTGRAFDLAELIRVIAGVERGTTGRPTIAVVVASGGIAMEASGLLDGSGITARALTKTLRRLANNNDVKAIVLRIDSPGGSALASDLLWHEVREAVARKPVIASVADMAASGGYYLASAATRIVAERTSLVGSIGVVGGKLVIGAALEKHGINTVTFAASPEPGAEERATYMSALTPWNDETRRRIRAQMHGVYELFIDRVATGRKMDNEEVARSAEGRVWTGAQGLERHLVDEFGGLARALALARKLGRVDERAPVVVEGGIESLLETLFLSDDAGEADVARVLEESARRRSALLRHMPERWVASLQSAEPLLQHEQVLTALPFALTVE
ncbi:MAG: S49 family peptidase [Polyangiaceae bacterium]|nr:S49 family peptidase [Polyangiaceae bacterium]